MYRPIAYTAVTSDDQDANKTVGLLQQCEHVESMHTDWLTEFIAEHGEVATQNRPFPDFLRIRNRQGVIVDVDAFLDRLQNLPRHVTTTI